MSASDYAAWYGALVATAVFIWDCIKWSKSGPQLKGEAHAGWRSFGFPGHNDQDLLFVKITNFGDRPTTLTSWGLYWYPAGASLSDKSKRKSFIMGSGLHGTGVIPSKLGPGDVWSGVSIEDRQVKEMLQTGTIYMAIGLSHTDDELLLTVTNPS